MSLGIVYIKIYTPMPFFTDANDQSFTLNPVLRDFELVEDHERVLML